MNACQLYIISPPQIADLAGFADALSGVLDAGPTPAFQLRLKGPVDTETGLEPPAADDVIRRAVDVLAPIVQSRDTAFLLNDRSDLAAELGCDGVHIGQADGPYADARAAMGAQASVGVTCHDSRHLAMEAAEAGADYVAFGAFFPTATKAPKTIAEVDLITWWAETFTTPCVAIGGVTPDNCAVLAQAGADFVAASSAIWNHGEGPAAGAQAFHAALQAAAANRENAPQEAHDDA